MHRHGQERQWQALSKEKAKMTPRAHVAHDDDPAETLVKQFTERSVIANGPDRVTKQYHFVALLGDEAAYEQIVGGPILKCGVSAEAAQPGSGGGDRGSQCKLDSFELPVDENTRVEIGHHADGLDTVGQSGHFGRDIYAGSGAHLRIAQRSDYLPEVVRAYTYVAVA